MKPNRKEADLGASFRSQVQKRWPNAFVYKIPDTFGLGGMRPFDCIIILNGLTFCIEFKRGDIEDPTDYQDFRLKQASENGAISWIVNEQNKSQKLKAMEALAYGK